MSDLTEFILARIADEQASAEHLHDRRYCDENYPCDCAAPEWVLAECEAKRAIVEEHAGVYWSPPGTHASWEDFTQCTTCRGDYPEDWPCPTLRLLALPFAGHPDYREEWKP